MPFNAAVMPLRACVSACTSGTPADAGGGAATGTLPWTGVELVFTGAALALTGAPLVLTGTAFVLTGAPLVLTGAALLLTGTPLPVTELPAPPFRCPLEAELPLRKELSLVWRPRTLTGTVMVLPLALMGGMKLAGGVP